MTDTKINLYDITRVGERWELRPSVTFALSSTVLFGFGCALMVYLAVLVVLKAHTLAILGVGAVFLAVAAYSASLAVRSWRTRRTPLTIEPDGRVLYGTKELCGANTVRAVRISGARGGEADDLEVSLALRNGSEVWMPHVYFAAFKAPALAHPFATKLAELLHVDVEPAR